MTDQVFAGTEHKPEMHEKQKQAHRKIASYFVGIQLRTVKPPTSFSYRKTTTKSTWCMTVKYD